MAGKPAARIDDTAAYARIVTGSSTDLIGCQGGVACSLCAEKLKVVTPVNPFNQTATDAGQAAAKDAGALHRHSETTPPGFAHFSSPQQEPANWQEIEAALKAAQADADATAVTAAHLLTPSSSWILLGKLDRFGCTQHYHHSSSLGQARISAVEDGVGRYYQHHHQKVLAAQDTQHLPSADSKAQCGHFWQADSSARLTGVSFVRDLTSSDAVAAMHGARAANTPHSTSLERYSYSPERLFCMN
jgi:hypothetical protein